MVEMDKHKSATICRLFSRLDSLINFGLKSASAVEDCKKIILHWAEHIPVHLYLYLVTPDSVGFEFDFLDKEINVTVFDSGKITMDVFTNAAGEYSLEEFVFADVSEFLSGTSHWFATR